MGVLITDAVDGDGHAEGFGPLPEPGANGAVIGGSGLAVDTAGLGGAVDRGVVEVGQEVLVGELRTRICGVVTVHRGSLPIVGFMCVSPQCTSTESRGTSMCTYNSVVLDRVFSSEHSVSNVFLIAFRLDPAPKGRV